MTTTTTTKIDDDDDEEIVKKKKSSVDDKLSINDKEDEDINEDDDDNDDIKSKPSESQTNPTSSRDIDEFAIELGLVCNKCMYVKQEIKKNELISFSYLFH